MAPYCQYPGGVPSSSDSAAPAPKVSVVSLGCSRNDVDSSELAGQLASEGWQLVDSPDEADVAVVNTCGFVEQAKKDSIDTVLDIADEDGPAVVAIGCLAERYGQELAQELPEAAAVLGFDSYVDMSSSLRKVLAGEKVESHVPTDRRTLLPLAPADRPKAQESAPVLGDFVRHLDGAPWQPVKLASGCDRRCAFCAIPRFRGSFVSRSSQQVYAECKWLGTQGVSEVFLVSENTTSYGKDLGNIRLLEELLPDLSELDGIERIRVSYLQPAEVRPGLIETLAKTPKVASYFDISFQHASATVLRRMRRFGSVDSFLGLVNQVREYAPHAGIRSNFIVGFPGETDEEFAELLHFLEEAKLDFIGIFSYSDEDGTEAVDMADKLPADVIAARYQQAQRLAEALMAERAELRIGEPVRVLVESTDEEDGVLGRAGHQGPESDGLTAVIAGDTDFDLSELAVGDYVDAVIVDSEGADVIAVPLVPDSNPLDVADGAPGDVEC